MSSRPRFFNSEQGSMIILFEIVVVRPCKASKQLMSQVIGISTNTPPGKKAEMLTWHMYNRRHEFLGLSGKDELCAEPAISLHSYTVPLVQWSTRLLPVMRDPGSIPMGGYLCETGILLLALSRHNWLKFFRDIVLRLWNWSLVVALCQARSLVQQDPDRLPECKCCHQDCVISSTMIKTHR